MVEIDGGSVGDCDGWDPGEVLWVPGVDYLGPWRAAKREADRLNAEFEHAGLSLAEVRAVARSRADGSAWVGFFATVEGARALAAVLAGRRA